MSASVRISRRAALAILEALRPADLIVPSEIIEATRARAELEKALQPKRSVLARRKRTRAKKDEKNAETAAIRAHVMLRAGGKCECGCGSAITGATAHMDHFFSRRERQTVRNCWALHSCCDAAKTLNTPNRGVWLQKFIGHCVVHGYDVEAEMARARFASYQAKRAAEVSK